MTSPRIWGVAATAATVLALGLAAEGCGWGGGEENARPSSDSPAAAATSPAPAATGTGPYPTPSAPGTHTSVAVEPSKPPGPATPSEPTDAGTPGVRTVRPGDIDRTDADAVSKGALTALWTFDTTVDRGPHDAELRAADAGWLTKAYAERLRAREQPPVAGAEWQTWADHQARTTVVPESTPDAAQPPDTDTEAWRQWIVTATPSGRAGWSGEPVVVAVYVRLTRTAADKPWRVADVTVR
ncbi:hypothetical protein [Streptomyces ziwulingensis]|uniref:Secreted protein n=1 Tax=Streptomyces ziwulingensis TaxID=1045501 RepID=A0ABP9B010_9ACTN